MTYKSEFLNESVNLYSLRSLKVKYNIFVFIRTHKSVFFRCRRTYVLNIYWITLFVNINWEYSIEEQISRLRLLTLLRALFPAPWEAVYHRSNVGDREWETRRGDRGREYKRKVGERERIRKVEKDKRRR